ncbi:MAG: ankyrin repeat domain-containing protein [Planctomycetota bacterium]
MLSETASPKGMDLNARAWPDGDPTALDGAIYATRMDIVRAMLDEGSDPNALGYEDGTMLMGAALISNVEAIELLLERGYFCGRS